MDFTIIGAGASGTAALYELSRAVERGAEKEDLAPPSLRVRVVERQEALGPGFPHSDRTARPFHLINMCARDMGVAANHPEDFQEWLDAGRDHLTRRFAEYRPYLESTALRDGPCTYVPRGVMGEYLKDRFQEAVKTLRRCGTRVEIFARCEVEDLREEREGVSLTVRDARTGKVETQLTDRVLLATGHWFEETEDGRFFPSPWPSEALERAVAPGERVAVIGSSLSAVDTALTLTADGVFVRRDSGELVYEPPAAPRTLALCSRSGLMPRVRGRGGSFRNAHFTREHLHKRRLTNGGFLALRDLFELLDADLRRAYGRKISWVEAVRPKGTPLERLERAARDAREGDGPNGELLWQSVLHQTFPMAREVYLSLSPEDRRAFDRDLATPFFMFASPMPLINAEKMLALMRAGVVEVVRLGSDYTLRREDAGRAFMFTYTEASGRRRRARFDRLIDARGQARSFETNPSPLARNLLASGTVQIEELSLTRRSEGPKSGEDTYRTGGVWIDPGTQRVMRRGKGGRQEISSRLYAVGVPTRGQILDASMVYSCTLAAETIVRDLLRRWEREG